MKMDAEMCRTIRDVLAGHADHIEAVAIFGSRATGQARANSDIDLVLYGDLGQEHVDRLWTLFEDSALPVTVDLLAYSANLYPPLKQHIDRVAVPLFSQEDLRAG